MKTSVRQLSKTRVRLTITVGKDALEAAQQVALVKLAKQVKVPGFRKGNVPPSVAAKHVDPNTLAQETADNALSKAVADAFISENIQALDRPEVELKKFVPGQEMEFTAEVDVVPPIKLGDYKKLSVKTDKISVSDDEVTQVIDRMRTGMAERKEVSRAAKNGDVVTLDFVGKKDGVPFEGGAAENYELELGSNSFIPGFEKGLIGLKPGEEKDLTLTFPKNYHVDDLAGASVVFETRVKKIEENILPKLDEAFVKKAAVGTEVTTVKQLKDDITSELLAQKEREVAEKRKDALVKALVDVSDVEAPQILVDDQVQSIEQDLSQNLLYRNITKEQYLSAQGFENEEAWQKKEVIPAAQARVKAGLVLSELAKELKIEATDEEKEAHLDRYKMQYANNPEATKQLNDPAVQRDIYNRLLSEKTVDRLVELNSK